jgi:hypothetical protein
VILRRRSLTPLFAPPISVILATNARRYIAGLVDFRGGRTDDWIGVFADATTTAAEAAKRLSAQIDTSLADLLQRAGSPRSDSVARKIILGLLAQPFVSADTAAARYDVTPTAARGALNPARRGRRACPHPGRPPPRSRVDQRRPIPTPRRIRTRPRPTRRRRVTSAEASAGPASETTLVP